MKARIKRTVYLIMLLTLVSVFWTVQVHAESGTVKYTGASLSKSAMKKNSWSPVVYNVKINGRKITLYGRLSKYSYDTHKEEMLKPGKRSFILSKDVKYSSWEYDRYYPMSKAQFLSIARSYNGIGVGVYVRNGIVYRVFITP